MHSKEKSPVLISDMQSNLPAPTLPLMEAFYTLQGEGFHQGKAAYFIRLGGCDVGCHWCDVKESWDMSAHPQIPIDEIVQGALKHPARLAVITGGEPLMHNLDELTAKLQENHFQTHLETSGAHPLTGHWNWICLSPKKFKAPLPEIYPAADELKVVIYNKHDFEWAESFVHYLKADCQLFLQPEWGKSSAILPQVIAYIKQNPRWQISLQVHKFMNIP